MREIRNIILGFVLLGIAFSSQAKEKKTVFVFHSDHCYACMVIKQEFLPKIMEKHKDILKWEEYDVDDSNNLALLVSINSRLSKSYAVTPSILVGDKLLKGKVQVEAELEQSIEEYLVKPHTPFDFFRKDLVSFFQNISVVTVIGSGLIDGINPCAFAVIVFFVSFLAIYGYRKREIILVGTAYCSAVFITYLLLGFGLFKFLYRMSGFYLLIKIFYYMVASMCFFLAIMAFLDYIKYKKTGDAGEMILQLPAFLKKKINVVIGSGLRAKDKPRSAWGLLVTAFGIGFMVSLLEAVCTGQVYIPTIVFILKTTNLRLKAILYLLLYNIMFVMPLIIVFILSLLGVGSQKLNKFLKKRLGDIKLIMFALFLILGILLLMIS